MFGCFYRNELENKLPGMTIENITSACGGTFVGDRSLLLKEIAGAVTDSRQVQKDYLFIPIKGARVDGHDFIPQVFEKGALVVLSDHALDVQEPYILVNSTTEAMKKIAAFYRTQLNCKVVGITGSVGKTSTKEMIASVLEQRYKVLKTEGNFNNEIGLPLTIFKIRAKHEVAVLEMGISDFGEMHRLASMAQPDIGVITNIGLCHLENLGTRDGILQAKTEMFDHLTPDGTVILNGDDDKLSTKREVNGKPVIFYGVGAESAFDISKSIYATDIQNLGLEGMRAQIHTPQGAFEAQIPIPGEHNVYNALAGTAVGLELGLTIREIAQGIAAVQTIAGRTNLLHVNGMTVIDDCYNANPVSMKASIDVLAHTSGRRIAVLGDMGELGEDEKRLHREVGEAVAKSGIDALFCTGELSRELADAASENPDCEVFYLETGDQLIDRLLSYVKPEDTVLVKASHFMEFPKVVEALTKEK